MLRFLNIICRSSPCVSMLFNFHCILDSRSLVYRDVCALIVHRSDRIHNIPSDDLRLFKPHVHYSAQEGHHVFTERCEQMSELDLPFYFIFSFISICKGLLLPSKHPHLRQLLQLPGNAKTLRQHAWYPAFFGFKSGHDVVVGIRLQAPACKCISSSRTIEGIEKKHRHRRPDGYLQTWETVSPRIPVRSRAFESSANSICRHPTWTLLGGACLQESGKRRGLG